MNPVRLFATTGDAVAHLDSLDDQSLQTTNVHGNEQQSREGHIVNGAMCVTVLPDQVITCQLLSSGDQRSRTNEP